jgi:DNA topoisomerase-1
VDDRGRPASIDSADVNTYIRETVGDDFTAKDFRTWAGTVLAAGALRQAASPGSRPNRRDVARAIKQVAARLGNTLAVCRKSYVHPAVIASFMDGTLPTFVTARVEARAASAGTGLRPEEAAVLKLLERRQREDKGGTTLARQLRRSLRVLQGGRSLNPRRSRS